MRHLKIILLICASTGMLYGYGQTVKTLKLYEKIIHDYYGGFEKKDWNLTAKQLANGFTFTSPAPDDHIPIEKFKEKCWPQAEHIKKFELIKIIGSGKEAFALIHVITDHDKVIRNLEYFIFSGGKIKSIEVFFGGTGQGYPTNEK